MASCQKLAIILVIKWFKNWCYQKMSIIKNVLLNWYSSMKKKLRKIPMIFDIKTIFESQILGLFDTSPLHQFSKFNNFLWVCWFLGKNISFFVSPDFKLHNLYSHNVSTAWRLVFVFGAGFRETSHEYAIKLKICNGATNQS